MFVRRFVTHAMCVGTLLLLTQVGQAAESCGWEYKVVDAQSVDKAIVKAARRDTVASSLEAVLNRLGADGWELVSQHQVSVAENLENGGGAWVAELVPAAMLLRRSTCN